MRKLCTYNRFAVGHQMQVDKVMLLQPDALQLAHEPHAVAAQRFVKDFHMEFLGDAGVCAVGL